MWITIKERITNCGELKEALKTMPDDDIPELTMFRIWQREEGCATGMTGPKGA